MTLRQELISSNKSKLKYNHKYNQVADDIKCSQSTHNRLPLSMRKNKQAGQQLLNHPSPHPNLFHESRISTQLSDRHGTDMKKVPKFWRVRCCYLYITSELSMSTWWIRSINDIKRLTSFIIIIMTGHFISLNLWYVWDTNIATENRFCYQTSGESGWEPSPILTFFSIDIFYL